MEIENEASHLQHRRPWNIGKLTLSVESTPEEPELDALDEEGDFHNARGFDACQEDVLLGGPVAGIADPVQAIQETAKFIGFIHKSFCQFLIHSNCPKITWKYNICIFSYIIWP